ncbi:MAG TPA: hypothetical protein VGM14_18185 [Streptosporangiaceae bacterium]
MSLSFLGGRRFSAPWLVWSSAVALKVFTRLEWAASCAETGSSGDGEILLTGWDVSSATVSCGASIGGRKAVLVMS